MKKIICYIITLVILVCLCSCANDSATVETEKISDNASAKYYNYKTDCQFGITNPPFGQTVTKGKDGYYIINEKGYVMFADIEQNKGTYLCNKPNCLHNDMNCNANTYLAESIAYNNDYIYYLYESVDEDPENTDGVSIKRMSADGSGKRETVYISEEQILDWIIHRGKLYITTCEYNPKDKSEESEAARIKLFSVSLDNSKKKDIIYDSKEYLDFATFDYLAAFDEYLYFSPCYQDKNEESVSSLKCYDIQKGTTKEVLLPNSKPCDASYIYPFSDRLVFKIYEDVYSCDLNCENVKKILTLGDKYHNIFSDGTYLYEDNFANFSSDGVSINKEDNRILKVYDNSLKIIDTLNLKNCADNFCPCDDKYFICINENNEVYYFDKAQIGSVNGGEWKQKQLDILN